MRVPSHLRLVVPKPLTPLIEAAASSVIPSTLTRSNNSAPAPTRRGVEEWFRYGLAINWTPAPLTVLQEAFAETVLCPNAAATSCWHLGGWQKPDPTPPSVLRAGKKQIPREKALPNVPWIISQMFQYSQVSSHSFFGPILIWCCHQQLFNFSFPLILTLLHLIAVNAACRFPFNFFANTPQFQTKHIFALSLALLML